MAAAIPRRFQRRQSDQREDSCRRRAPGHGGRTLGENRFVLRASFTAAPLNLRRVCSRQDGEVFISEKCSGQQEMLWSPSPEIRSRRLKRRVVQMSEQEEFESER